jgi:hypothetical protein
MLKPGDSYASSSELADFGARLLRDLDQRTNQIKMLDYSGGEAAGRAAAETLRVASAVTAEFDLSLALKREGPWGERLAKQKQALAAAAEAHMRKLERMVGDVLPMQAVRIGGRNLRNEPNLEQAPEPAALARAKAILTFFAGIRSIAAQSGYGTMRTKVQEQVARSLNGYLEELLAIMHSGEVEHIDNARLFLEVVADFSGLVHDEQAAQIVRRRAAAV